MFSYSVGERKILQTILVSFFFLFFSFYFLNAIQGDNYSNTAYVLGHKCILGPSQSSYPRLMARAKIESESGPTQKLYCYILAPPGNLHQ